MPVFPEKYIEFVALFNKQKFFEAHEALEAEWRHEQGKNDFYKGLIQLAAVLVHVQRSNFQGAGNLILTAEKNLAPYFPDYQGIEVKKLCEEVKSSVISADSCGTGPVNVSFPIITLAGSKKGDTRL